MEAPTPELYLVVEGDAILAEAFGGYMETLAGACSTMIGEEISRSRGPSREPIRVRLNLRSIRSGSVIAFIAIVCTHVVAFEETRIAVIQVIRRLIRAGHIILNIDLQEPAADRIEPEEADVVHRSRDFVERGGASRIELRFYGDNANVFVMDQSMASAMDRKEQAIREMTGVAREEPKPPLSIAEKVREITRSEPGTKTGTMRRAKSELGAKLIYLDSHWYARVDNMRGLLVPVYPESPVWEDLFPGTEYLTSGVLLEDEGLPTNFIATAIRREA